MTVPLSRVRETVRQLSMGHEARERGLRDDLETVDRLIRELQSRPGRRSDSYHELLGSLESLRERLWPPLQGMDDVYAAAATEGMRWLNGHQTKGLKSPQQPSQEARESRYAVLHIPL